MLAGNLGPLAVLEILVYQKPDSGAKNYLQGRQGQ